MARTAFIVIASAWAVVALAQPAPQPEKAPPQGDRQASAAAGGTAPRAQDPAEAQRLFRELDRNGDGYLTDEELWAQRGRSADWAAVDRDGDGRITPNEFTVLRR